MNSLSFLPHLQPSPGGARLIVDGAPFFILGGELHNSSASSLNYMESIWPRLCALHCNTVLATISWELLEPQEGVYDFALLEGLVDAARQHELKLVLLWFGTYKNTHSSYAPEWVKTDWQRFPRAQKQDGINIGSVSVLSAEARRCDARAFAAMMRRLKEIDGEQHTVVMVQVENEVGILGTPRDFSPLAQSAFAEPVPATLTKDLDAHFETLRPEVFRHFRRDASGDANWSKVFGPDADEIFMAWHFARFLEEVAAQGRAEYALPLFANAWIVQSEGQEPGGYPSGGPVASMLDVWRAAAPTLEFLAPDIYLDDFPAICADYARGNNPLFIPEARRDGFAPASAFYALGAHGAIGFCPFGIDSIGAPGTHQIEGVAAQASFQVGASTGELLAASYAVLREMMPLLAEWSGTPRALGLWQKDEKRTEHELGGYRLKITYRELVEGQPAGGLIISPRDGEFIVAGFGFRVDFAARDEEQKADFLEISEGRYHHDQWQPARRLNGDELAVNLGNEPGVRLARLYTFPRG